MTEYYSAIKHTTTKKKKEKISGRKRSVEEKEKLPEWTLIQEQ